MYGRIASEKRQRLAGAIFAAELPAAGAFAPGDVLYGIPWHICPTVALHARAVVVRAGRAEGRWSVIARERELTI